MNPHASDKYEPGAILVNSWGYDQTNIDFYVIVKRRDNDESGTTWLTLAPMTYGDYREDLPMQGTCTPGVIDAQRKTIRRKLWKGGDGTEQGLGVDSYGWCSLWDGKPIRWTAYA